MNDLWKKLNVLVKAGIRDVIGDVRSGELPRKALSSLQLGSDVDREIALLRERINEALAYEDELRQRVQALQAEVESWDAKADEAVAAGNDVEGRYAIDRMHRAQQRTAIAEADLRDHQQVTQELILRVNMLESAVADVRRAEAEKPPEDTPLEKASPGLVLSDVLRGVREQVSRMGDLIASRDEINEVSAPDTLPVDDHAVEDELEARRQRLSKPK